MKTTALIMAGGKGERFWPKSRVNMPKQFLSLTDDGKTMIQLTVERISPLVDIKDVYVATNKNYRELVKQQLPGIPEENILCEPIGRNTAPCIGLGAIHISKEFLYQLSKLKKRDDDTPKKYVIRNRYNFTVFALAIMLANSMIGNRNTISAQEPTYETSTQSTKSDTEQEKNDNETKNKNKRKNEIQTKILLTRKYVIKPGDYLSKIAVDAGISIDKLQTINNIRSADLIKVGDTIIVPYNIESENKEFYTKKVVLYDRDLSKIAAEYETDFDTLYRLNEEAIEKVTDNTYVVLSDTIEVPNFITTTELNSMKEKTKNY